MPLMGGVEPIEEKAATGAVAYSSPLVVLQSKRLSVAGVSILIRKLSQTSHHDQAS